MVSNVLYRTMTMTMMMMMMMMMMIVINMYFCYVHLVVMNGKTHSGALKHG